MLERAYVPLHNLDAGHVAKKGAAIIGSHRNTNDKKGLHLYRKKPENQKAKAPTHAQNTTLRGNWPSQNAARSTSTAHAAGERWQYISLSKMRLLHFINKKGKKKEEMTKEGLLSKSRLISMPDIQLPGEGMRPKEKVPPQTTHIEKEPHDKTRWRYQTEIQSSTQRRSNSQLNGFSWVRAEAPYY